MHGPDAADNEDYVVETGETEVALVYADGRLLEVLPPKRRRLYPRSGPPITAEVVPVVGAGPDRCRVEVG